jgi:hypothetical protein
MLKSEPCRTTHSIQIHGTRDQYFFQHGTGLDIKNIGLLTQNANNMNKLTRTWSNTTVSDNLCLALKANKVEKSQSPSKMLLATG